MNPNQQNGTDSKQYWKGLGELNGSESYNKHCHDEFAESLPPFFEVFNENELGLKTHRRDFLKMMGFSLTAATVAASCEIPVRKAIPYLIKPEEIIPGMATWYASTYADGQDYCSILVKTREGRPIKIEGNELSGITRGGTSARVQASILGLYDAGRLTGPTFNGKEISWDKADEEIKKQLASIAEQGGKIVILSSSIISPSTRQVIKDFSAKYPGAKHIIYDVASCSGMLLANKECFGTAVIPSYRFDTAQVIVSFSADFLGTWISPIEYAKQYVVNRKVNKKKPTMSRHIQFEATMSLTGSNADERYRLKPSEEGAVLVALYNEIATKAGATPLARKNAPYQDIIKRIADELWQNKGKALVVCGSNDMNAQIIVNGLNYLLDSYGNTIDIANPCYLRQGIDEDIQQLIEEMHAGKVDALIIYNVNPVYSLPEGARFKSGLTKVKLTIAFNDRLDETASMVNYVCPDHHYLEAWNDAEPKKGFFSLAQPTIAPLFNTRAAQASLLKWSGSDISYYEYIREYWRQHIFPQQKAIASFDSFWNQVLHDGVFEPGVTAAIVPPFQGDLSKAAEKLFSNKANGIELVLYESVNIGNGQHANNPWLQETPDPITKVTWDNYVLVSKKFAEQQGIRIHDYDNPRKPLIKVKAQGYEVELPVLIQPGQADDVIAIAVGYGREKAGKAANGVGKNVYPFVQFNGKTFLFYTSGASVELTTKTYTIAQTQLHHNLLGRPIVKETVLEKYVQSPKAGNEDRDKVSNFIEGKSLYPIGVKHEYPGHHWGMSIDLNSCIGCNACVVACTAENNVPVVGKHEVYRKHEMHWLRIDRYYTGDEEDPEVVHQPMLCQHCDNAPCENVCPVAATNHSIDGINQMIYNRCIGTRYCANNCPYKVRRFNWLDYTRADSFPWNEYTDKGPMGEDLGRMVLNPDVVVRARGVMEKCTFCIQRIQEGRLNAKKEGRPLKDGEIKTACQSACPTNAIIFGDMNDLNSAVAKSLSDERTYYVLEELHTLPSVGYMTKVRNRPEQQV